MHVGGVGLWLPRLHVTRPPPGRVRCPVACTCHGKTKMISRDIVSRSLYVFLH